MPSVVQLLLNLCWYVLLVEESYKVELEVQCLFFGNKDLPRKNHPKRCGSIFNCLFLKRFEDLQPNGLDCRGKSWWFTVFGISPE